ncbi:hypothetical protein [Rivularia sp. UHCC 0363]
MVSFELSDSTNSGGAICTDGAASIF